MTHLAEAVGIDLAVTRAMIEITGLMLGRDYWSLGPQLADWGLADMELAQVKEFVMTGRHSAEN